MFIELEVFYADSNKSYKELINVNSIRRIIPLVTEENGCRIKFKKKKKSISVSDPFERIKDKLDSVQLLV